MRINLSVSSPGGHQTKQDFSGSFLLIQGAAPGGPGPCQAAVICTTGPYSTLRTSIDIHALQQVLDSANSVSHYEQYPSLISRCMSSAGV